MITTGTLWRGAGTYDRALAEARFNGGAYAPEVVGRILAQAEIDCREVGLHVGALLGQVSTETGWFRFGGQVDPAQFNFGGIGATDGGAAGAWFATPEDGMHAMLAHHANYLFGPFNMWPLAWLWLQPYAIRNAEVLAAGYGGTVSIVGDYGSGRWASDPDYAATIVARANEIAASTGGDDVSVPRPPMLLEPRSPNKGYQNGYVHDPWVVVWHITQGTNSLGWLCNPSSGASSNYLIARNGVINELVPPSESAWANGDAKKPDLGNPVIASIEASGANYNQRSISIECEGYSKYWEPGALVTPAQVDALVALTAWLCDMLAIPPDRTCIVRHQQINDVDRHNCPGFSEELEMLPWIDRVAGMVGGGGDVKEPEAGTATEYLNARGELIAVVNFGGYATRLLGVNYADIGGSVANDDEEPCGEYDISLLQGEMGTWKKR